MTDHQHAATGPGPVSAPEGATAPPPEPADESGRFRRDRRHQLLGGVCAGLGRQCDMDPVIFRITLAVLSATGGIGLIFYGFAWLFVPYEDEDENGIRRLLTGRVDGHTLTAVLFALVGCGVFLTMLSNDGVLSFAVILSLLLAGAGYWSRRRGAPSPDHITAQAVADAPPEPQAPPAPSAFPSWWRDPIVKDGTHVGGTGYLWGPRDSRDMDIAAAVDVSLDPRPGTRGIVYAPLHRPAKPRGPRGTGGWIFLLALLAGGLGTGLTWEGHPHGTSLQTGLACALAVFGIGVAVSAFLGRTGRDRSSWRPSRRACSPARPPCPRTSAPTGRARPGSPPRSRREDTPGLRTGRRRGRTGPVRDTRPRGPHRLDAGRCRPGPDPRDRAQGRDREAERRCGSWATSSCRATDGRTWTWRRANTRRWPGAAGRCRGGGHARPRSPGRRGQAEVSRAAS
ncbi:hypothetical protein GCM10023238_18930 [Streptomyces heliomycini]